MAKPYTWEQLRSATLRRQFPSIRGRGQAAVRSMIERVGPIQSQVARSPFVTVASRLPGAKHADIVALHESFQVVRGSSLRGTVHTCVAEQHPLVDTVTRRSLETLWRRQLKLSRVGVADVQAAMEAFAAGEWRSPEELRTHLVEWVGAHEGAEAANAAATTGVGRAFAHVHSALIRRPLGDVAWDRQGTPGYRVAAETLGVGRSPWLDDPDGALVALCRQHLRAFGPANRRDVAWWTGEGLRAVDQALATLADELTTRPGPDGQQYHDLADAPRGSGGDPGVRLLPEYDAVLVGYDPKTRDRFLDPAHLPHVWLTANGTFSPAVLRDGRLCASWRLTGNGPERRVEVAMFPGMARLDPADVSDQVTALERALAITIADVAVS